MAKQCAKVIAPIGEQERPCQNKAKVKRDGEWFCTLHGGGAKKARALNPVGVSAGGLGALPGAMEAANAELRETDSLARVGYVWTYAGDPKVEPEKVGQK